MVRECSFLFKEDNALWQINLGKTVKLIPVERLRWVKGTVKRPTETEDNKGKHALPNSASLPKPTREQKHAKYCAKNY